MKQAIKIGGKFVQLKEFDELPNDAPPFWTDEKNEIMRQYYPTKDATALAAKLGTTRAALVRQASSLGVRKAQHKDKKEKQHA